MVTQETAVRIFNCYREIEAATKLLKDTQQAQQDNIKEGLSRDAPVIKDAFGRERNLELGVPSGSDSRRLFQVSPDLAIAIMQSHLAKMQAQLIELNELARIELDTPAEI